MRRLYWHLLWFFGYGALGVGLAAIIGLVLVLQGSADLQRWHTADLDAEFQAEDGVESFSDYLALEEELFAQLDERIVAKVPQRARGPVNRFTKDSFSDPKRFSRDWNRTFELEGTSTGPGVLLLHGMSDSPYSLRSLGLELNRAGAHVVGLRLPGHGTAPVGLTTARWQDMAAATALAVAHLRERTKERPIYLVGYSNGGALSVEYALHAAQNDALEQVNGVVLLSPAIGITPAAALAVWQERLGKLLRLKKLAWNSVIPEYDPFKYQSFAVNAGDQSYRLTLRLSELLGNLADLESDGGEVAVPRILAFQSGVDATVSTAAVLDGLLNRLPSGGHEFVVFDVNRRLDDEQLLGDDPKDELATLINSGQQKYAVTVITNEVSTSREVVEKRREPGQSEVRESRLGLAWPAGVFSLSHVALPFPPNDPLYGDGESVDPTEPASALGLGDLRLKGERGVLLVPAGDLVRQRYNPFHSYLVERVLGFMDLSARAVDE